MTEDEVSDLRRCLLSGRGMSIEEGINRLEAEIDLLRSKLEPFERLEKWLKDGRINFSAVHHIFYTRYLGNEIVEITLGDFNESHRRWTSAELSLSLSLTKALDKAMEER